jgi:hypothetical protein
MSERVIDASITIVVDTNKGTHQCTFDDIHDAVAWWNDLAEEFGLSVVELCHHDEPPRDAA